MLGVRPFMLAAAVLSCSLLAASPPAGPSPHPTLAQLDQKRFELHLGGRAGATFGGGLAFGGGLTIGLGVRLWRGLYLVAGISESAYQARPVSDGSAAESSFRHGAQFHDSPDPETNAAAVAGDEIDATGTLAGQILLGVRYEVRTPKTTHLRPTFFLGATHLHEATFKQFASAPGKTLAGTASHIRHRTGIQAGVGLRVPFPERWGPVAPRFSLTVDADVAYYFDSHPGRLQTGLGAGVQVVF